MCDSWMSPLLTYARQSFVLFLTVRAFNPLRAKCAIFLNSVSWRTSRAHTTAVVGTAFQYVLSAFRAGGGKALSLFEVHRLMKECEEMCTCSKFTLHGRGVVSDGCVLCTCAAVQDTQQNALNDFPFQGLGSLWTEMHHNATRCARLSQL